MGSTLGAGESFAGYRIERPLGAGGMGEVYLARDRDLPRFVALKILKGNGDAELARRFLREAEAMARLDHPNIVTVHARGETAGRLWIAMTFVEGGDLAGVLARGPIPLPTAVRILAEVADALDYAHGRGIVHRDIKPANILLTETRVLITDFGIAKTLDESMQLTSVSQVPASFQYVAPERLLLDATVDGRADVYSLGCTFFQMVTGSVPYRGADLHQLIAAHLQAPIPAVSRRNPLLPTALDAVLTRALAKNPADRYATCEEFARAAGRCLRTSPPNSVPITVRPPRTAGPSLRGYLRRHRRRTIAGAVVAVAILGTTAAVRGWDDSSTGGAPAVVTIAVGQSPNAIAVDPAAHTAYVTNGAANTVSVLDLVTRTVTATIPVGKYPNGVAVDSAAHTVYVTDGRDNAVSVIDTVSRAVTASIPVGRNPTGVAVDPDIHTAYVTGGSIMGSPGDNSVSMIDTVAHTVTATIPVGKNPNGVAVDTGAHTAYVANGDSTVSVINPEAQAVFAIVPVSGGALAIAVDSGSHAAYVVGGAHENYVVSVLELASRKVTATIPAGDLPIAVALDPGTGSAYVANNAALTVSVIDTGRRTITSTLRVGQGPQGVAVDPATHTVYVANLGDSTVSVLTR
ncbi:serine/threonine-protein kinase [Nocardia sp. NPDC056000]|uniref:serine/threonine-protein kinase n=1 Tax=Nocardia sp. NPDC056000 TaxID=3345674 RepID=UPI0035DC9FC2